MGYLKPDFITDNKEQFLNEDIEYINIDLDTVLKERGLVITSYGRIDWRNISTNLIGSIDDDEIRGALIKYISQKADTVRICWANAEKYCIEVKTHFVEKYLEYILYEDWDFWIMSVNKKWLIEYYHEGEVVIKEFDEKMRTLSTSSEAGAR